MEKIPKNKVNVIISGKDFINLMFYSNAVKELGWNAEIADNEEKILDLYKKGKFDLILIDFNILDHYGFKEIKNIRELEKKDKSKVLIIGLTEYVPEKDERIIYETGIDDYALKPLDQKALHEILCRNIEAHRIKNATLTC